MPINSLSLDDHSFPILSIELTKTFSLMFSDLAAKPDLFNWIFN